MKKFVLVVAFALLTMSIFSQILSVVISDFTSRARDVHEDDLVTVMEMFMVSLASGKTVNVIDSAILKKKMTSLEFGTGDWSDSVKTTKLGEELNAIYFISGTITQLGTSLTFNISVRDIKTLTVIVSDQNRYTLENVWDNKDGIPAQLSDIGSVISKGISVDYNKRQQEIKDKIAREEAERQRKLAQEEDLRKKTEEDRRIGDTLVGEWINGIIPVYPSQASQEAFVLTFNSDGTFSAKHIYYNSNDKRISDTGKTGQKVNLRNREYTGTYTREGNKLTLNWSYEEELTEWIIGRNSWEERGTSYGSSRSGTSNATINIYDFNRLSITGFESFANKAHPSRGSTFIRGNEGMLRN